MRFARRRFLHALTGLAAVPTLVAVAEESSSDERSRPLGLTGGSTIGIACPASGVSRKEMSSFEALCGRWNVRLIYGSTVGRRQGYLSGSDQERADEFMRFIDNPAVDAIVCGRGGYGVMRMLPMLDYRAIAQRRPLVMGFSDITALLIAIEQLSGVVTFHGPVASSTFDAFTTASMERTVLRPAASSPPLPDASYPEASTFVPGVARGRLTGGNLAMIAATLGTRYEIDTTNAILFLEEINEEPYRIDRMLTQLWLAGKLQTCRAVVMGNFRDCEAKGSNRAEPSLSLMQVLRDRIGSLGIPAVYGMPFGHVRSKLTIPLGVMAELDATNRRFRLLEQAVSHRA